MPSRSPAQARLMRAAAHTPGGYGGVPQSVGAEFNRADKAMHRNVMADKGIDKTHVPKIHVPKVKTGLPSMGGKGRKR